MNRPARRRTYLQPVDYNYEACGVIAPHSMFWPMVAFASALAVCIVLGIVTAVALAVAR